MRQIYLPTLDEERGVSIHAPWEGCDRYTTIFIVARIMFQFTHPGKGATNRTLPKEEVLRVSIHAPWEGCDPSNIVVAVLTSRFNSRTLGRVRPYADVPVVKDKEFQFTHPGKGATQAFGTVTSESYMFQFTHPGKGATKEVGVYLPTPEVSIHAPWEGCDLVGHTIGETSNKFQFTHPGKGATSAY